MFGFCSFLTNFISLVLTLVDLVEHFGGVLKIVRFLEKILIYSVLELVGIIAPGFDGSVFFLIGSFKASLGGLPSAFEGRKVTIVVNTIDVVLVDLDSLLESGDFRGNRLDLSGNEGILVLDELAFAAVIAEK